MDTRNLQDDELVERLRKRDETAITDLLQEYGGKAKCLVNRMLGRVASVISYETVLVLARKVGECIVIDGGITITVLDIRGGRARIGISAPTSVRVLRSELTVRPDVEHAEVASACPTNAPGGLGPAHNRAEIVEQRPLPFRDSLVLDPDLDRMRPEIAALVRASLQSPETANLQDLDSLNTVFDSLPDEALPDDEIDRIARSVRRSS